MAAVEAMGGVMLLPPPPPAIPFYVSIEHALDVLNP